MQRNAMLLVRRVSATSRRCARADTDVTRVLPAGGDRARVRPGRTVRSTWTTFSIASFSPCGEGVATCARVCSSRLKPSVFDPQGRTIADALHSLGYGGVEDVRQGKYFELDLATAEAAEARRAGRRSGRQACSPIRSSKAIASRSTDHEIRRSSSFPAATATTTPYHAARSTSSARRPSTSGTRTPISRARRRHPARRLLARRLPARPARWRVSRRSWVAVRAVRGARRSGARHLQRVSDSARGRARSRRDAAQPRIELPLRARARSRRAGRHTVHGGVPASARCCGFRSRHGEGNYFAPPDADRVSSRPIDQIVFRYTDRRRRG